MNKLSKRWQTFCQHKRYSSHLLLMYPLSIVLKLSLPQHNSESTYRRTQCTQSGWLFLVSISGDIWCESRQICYLLFIKFLAAMKISTVHSATLCPLRNNFFTVQKYIRNKSQDKMYQSTVTLAIISLNWKLEVLLLRQVLFDLRAGNSNLAKSLGEKSNHAMYQDENPHRCLLSLQN